MKNARKKRREQRLKSKNSTSSSTSGDGRIFIQIASYRDPLLESTVQDCIDHADHPENLVFSICRQFHPDDKFDTLDKWRKDKRFRIIDVPYEDAQGVCWARHAVQQQYQDEEYTLQLDSHHRFAEGWDSLCVGMLKDLQGDGYAKPLLTSYIPSFNPENDPEERSPDPWWMTFDRFIPEGAVFFLPAPVPNWQERTRPMRARFYSAHFAFSIGAFAREVQHDPEYYFHGEEISIAVRAYTWGYDLFAPHKIVAWHEYTRRGRPKHWDDASNAWGKWNKKSHKRNRQLFEMDGEGPRPDDLYGFGPHRTLRDYEEYAGLNFKRRAIQKHTDDNLEPPNPEAYESEEEFQKSFLRIFKHCIDVGYKKVPLKNDNGDPDYDFWCVAYQDENGKELYREDAGKHEIKRMFNDPDGYCKVWRKFMAEDDNPPRKWLVWPHSVDKGWQKRIEGSLRNTAVVS